MTITYLVLKKERSVASKLEKLLCDMKVQLNFGEMLLFKGFVSRHTRYFEINLYFLFLTLSFDM